MFYSKDSTFRSNYAAVVDRGKLVVEIRASFSSAADREKADEIIKAFFGKIRRVTIGENIALMKAVDSPNRASDPGKSNEQVACEAAEGSQAKLASFMQSLRESDLTRFLTVGQKCCIF